MTIIAGPLPTPTVGDQKMTPAVDRRARYSTWLPGLLVPDDGAVTQAATPNMTVRVAAISGALIDDGIVFGEGKYWFESDAQATVGPLNASDAANPRIDLIVARVNDTEAGSGSLTPELAFIAGTPAASPAAPSVPARCLALAEVRVNALATTVTNANITDRRTRTTPANIRWGLGSVLNSNGTTENEGVVSFSPGFADGVVPAVVVTHRGPMTNPVVWRAASANDSGFSAWVRKADGSSFGATVTYEFSWVAIG